MNMHKDKNMIRRIGHINSHNKLQNIRLNSDYKLNLQFVNFRNIIAN